MYFFIFGFQRFVWWPKWTPASRSSFIVIWLMGPPLPLRELEPGAGAALTVLLALLHARVAREEAGLLECPAELAVEEAERAGDPVADRAGLARAPAALDERDDVELVARLGELQGLADDHLEHVVRKVVLEGAVVDLDRSLAGTEEHAGDGFLAASDGLVLEVRHGKRLSFVPGQTATAAGACAVCGWCGP